jgi:preprotein translocase subunit SecF
MKSFPFIRYTWLWFTISLVLLGVGMAAIVNHKIQTGQYLNYGIDFTGGTLIEFKVGKEGDLTQQIGASINEAVPNYLSQITITDQNTYIAQGKDISQEDYATIKNKLIAEDGSFEEVRFTTIGPKIGETLKRKAVTALLVSMGMIVLYIAYAFRHVPRRVSSWRFGITAIIALAHDALTTVGFFALAGYEVNALFITALLTVIGFSVHDTIVVFDRIRENLGKQTREDTFTTVADRSLNETIARSINTSLSVLITLLALFIFGPESIHTFVYALLVGILVGTYSSIFIATPLLTLWQEKRPLR